MQEDYKPTDSGFPRRAVTNFPIQAQEADRIMLKNLGKFDGIYEVDHLHNLGHSFIHEVGGETSKIMIDGNWHEMERRSGVAAYLHTTHIMGFGDRYEYLWFYKIPFQKKEWTPGDEFIKVWKHHVSEDFANGTPTHPNGGGVGGTVFLSYDRMIPYLFDAGREFHIAELWVRPWEIEVVDDVIGMATLKYARLSLTGFKPMNHWPVPGRIVNLFNVGQHPIMLTDGGAIMSGHHRFMVAVDLSKAEERVLEQLDEEVAGGKTISPDRGELTQITLNREQFVFPTGLSADRTTYIPETYLCYPDGYTITKEVVTPRLTTHYLRQPDGSVIDIADTGFIREKRRLWDAAHGEPSKPKK